MSFRPTTAPLYVVGIALTLTACTQGGDARSRADGGISAFVGRQCNVDAECGSLRCDKIRHHCICLSDDSCKTGNPADPPTYCNNFTGLCVAEIVGCTSDAQCQSGEYCDPSVRSCRPLKAFCEACSTDGECGGAQDNCVLEESLQTKYCAKACADWVDCPRGAECKLHNGQKQCWPAPNPLKPAEVQTCQSFQGCVPDSFRTCNGNADCAALSGQRCDPSTGRCIAIQRVCPFGTVCDPRNKICVSECNSDADCGDTRLRCSRKICEPVGECAQEGDCPQNRVCQIPPGGTTGQCLPFCTKDADCPLGNRCLRTDDTKYRCVPGCVSHAGCPVNQRCNPNSHQCEGPFLGAIQTCQATLACDACELCNPTTLECFPARAWYPYHCKPCNPSLSDCPGGACLAMADAKFYCALMCTTQSECPQGFNCLLLSSGGGSSACVPSDKICADRCE